MNFRLFYEDVLTARAVIDPVYESIPVRYTIYRVEKFLSQIIVRFHKVVLLNWK